MKFNKRQLPRQITFVFCYDSRNTLAIGLMFLAFHLGFSQNPSVPPGENFDLSEWKVTLPDQSEASETDLVNGFESANEFYTDTETGAMVFRCKNSGQTGGSTYPRSELREMLRAGNTSISTQGIGLNNWVFSSSSQASREASGGVDGVMNATVAVDYVSTTGETSKIGRVIIGQIHASDNEPCRLYYRKLPNNALGSIYFAHEPNTTSEQWYEMIGTRSSSASSPEDGIALGEKFSYEIKVVGNTLTVSIFREGKQDVVQEVDMSGSGFEDDWMYFKAGVYNQNNSGNADDYCQVSFFALTKSHSNPKNNEPTSVITSPSNNAEYLEGDEVEIEAEASDSDGSIEKVEFYQGSVKLGEDTSKPYTFSWDNVSTGNYSLTAKAIDNENGYTVSDMVNIIVSPIYTKPYEIPKFQDFIGESKLQAPTSQTIATQSDLINGYSDEYFYVENNDQIAFKQSGSSNRTELRHENNWSVLDGNRILRASIDIVDQSCDQLTVLQIHDDANEGIGPNKPLLRVYKHLTKTPENHLWAAIKVDAEGENTTHIDLGADPGGFFNCEIKIVNGTLQILFESELKVNKDISYWSFPGYWKAGVYLQDDGNALAHFDSLYQVIEVNQLPNVRITEPNDGSTIEEGEDMTIRVEASDHDGTISKVAFYAGDDLIGEDDFAPYALIWRNVLEGSYELTAWAYDDKNEITKSAGVNIKVIDSDEVPLRTPEDAGTGIHIYPNPTQRNFTLAYSQRFNGPVHISIHDVSGRKVDELIYEERDVAIQTIPWEIPYGLSDGVFFIRITSGRETQSKRMIYLGPNNG